ncbi:MAG: FixH family protein [Rhodospirillales bacterium]|nr:FixH family protein [Rhodospirillales bacterium]
MRLLRSPEVCLPSPALGVLTAALIAVSSLAHAADRSQEYRFEVVDQPVAVGTHSEFNLKLTWTSTGQPVEDATITRGHLEMTMPHFAHKGSMPMATTMGGEVKLLGAPSPGLYRLMGDVSMPGTWKLDIIATVPSEAEPVEGTATFEARQ